MGKKADIPKNQHYVPRMLMHTFAAPGAGKHDQIRVFDKREQRSFSTSMENVLSGRYFNTIWREGIVVDAEGPLSKLEDKAAPILRKIVDQRSIAKLSGEEQATLAFFIAIQFIRGPDTRARIDQMMDGLAERMAAIAPEGAQVEPVPTGDERKEMVLRLMQESGADLAKLLLAKAWILFAPNEGEFYLGDTPVVLHNDRNFGPYGNIGLAVPGIQVFLPLAPDLLLALWCPSLLHEIEQAAVTWRGAIAANAALAVLGLGAEAREAVEALPRYRASLEHTQAILEAIASGAPAPVEPDSLRFMNHLQVRSAERYILARLQPFDLVLEMINHKDEFRTGMRLSW